MAKEFRRVRLAQAPTAINVIDCEYIAANGSVLLMLGDQREDVDGVEAIVDVGRYALTPRALRVLHNAVSQAVKDYETANGAPLPKLRDFVMRAAQQAATELEPDP